MVAGSDSKTGPVVIAGCALDTGNLGVSALGLSLLAGLSKRLPDRDLMMLDHAPGTGTIVIDGIDRPVRRVGAILSKRLWKRHNWPNLTVSLAAGKALGHLGNAGARALAEASAVIDISGGDSFTDLYGPKRFATISQPKELALRLGVPLCLAPQTYGPFETEEARSAASRYVRAAATCWSRDQRSHGVLADLLGGATDDAIHRCGVDVAFCLPVREPTGAIGDEARAWCREEGGPPLIGLNVSGLIYSDEVAAREQYGFKADYRAVIHTLCRRWLDETDARVLLIPHVIAPRSNSESDLNACDAVARELGNSERVGVAEPEFDATGVKWVISRCDWFCGTRMHSTIAGLSTQTPTAAIAYSPKTVGVFETCGQGERVIDPRSLSTEETIEGLWNCWLERDQAAASLAEHVPAVKELADAQLDGLADAARGGAAR